MESAILSTKSQKDLNLILKLAEKIGISTRMLTQEEMEDYGLSNAIDTGKTGEYINIDSFISELQDEGVNR